MTRAPLKSDGLEREAECDYAVTWFRGNPILRDVSLNATYPSSSVSLHSIKALVLISQIYRSPHSLSTSLSLSLSTVTLSAKFTSLPSRAQVLPSSVTEHKVKFPPSLSIFAESPLKLMYKVRHLFHRARSFQARFATRKRKRRDGSRCFVLRNHAQLICHGAYKQHTHTQERTN